jgi:hypothetical protein
MEKRRLRARLDQEISRFPRGMPHVIGNEPRFGWCGIGSVFSQTADVDCATHSTFRIAPAHHHLVVVASRESYDGQALRDILALLA